MSNLNFINGMCKTTTIAHCSVAACKPVKNLPKGSLAKVNIGDYPMVNVQTQPFGISRCSHHNYNIRA